MQDVLRFMVGIGSHAARCEEFKETRGGVRMRNFRVVNALGYHVPCVAFARQAEDARLENGCEVALYCFSTRTGFEGQNGSFRLFDESHLAVLRISVSVLEFFMRCNWKRRRAWKSFSCWGTGLYALKSCSLKGVAFARSRRSGLASFIRKGIFTLSLQ